MFTPSSLQKRKMRVICLIALSKVAQTVLEKPELERRGLLILDPGLLIPLGHLLAVEAKHLGGK